MARNSGFDLQSFLSEKRPNLSASKHSDDESWLELARMVGARLGTMDAGQCRDLIRVLEEEASRVIREARDNDPFYLVTALMMLRAVINGRYEQLIVDSGADFGD